MNFTPMCLTSKSFSLVSFIRNLDVNFTRALGNWEEEAFLKLRLGFKKASKKALV